MINIRNAAIAIAAAIVIGGSGTTRPAAAFDLVMTSELAATHWKAVQFDELGADIQKRSNGSITPKVYHAATLYKDKDALAALGSGAVNLVWPVSNWLESINPAYGVINLPFGLKDSMMEHSEFREGLTKLMSSLIEDSGLVVLGIGRATEVVLIAKNPIKSVDDLKNTKIRVPSGKINQHLAEAYSAAPVTMATTEVATAMAQGAIDVVVSSPGGWQMFGPAAKHATIVPNQQIFTYSLVADKAWLAGLSEEHRGVILAAVEDLMARQWSEAIVQDQKALDSMVAKGGEVSRLSGPPVAEFEALAKEVVNQFRKEHPDTVAKFEALVAKLPQ